MKPTLVQFKDLLTEAVSGQFGPNWKILLEECVEEYCRGDGNKPGLKPQTFGFKGHGKFGLDWADEDIQTIAQNVFEEAIAPRNQHVSIGMKARDAQHVKGMLNISVRWQVLKLRAKTVDRNVVENLKGMLKDDHGITLPMGKSIDDPLHQARLIAIKENFPAPRWRKEGALNRDGKPYTRLPKVFKDSDLRKIAGQIAAMNPLPTQSELWEIVGEVLGSHEGTQEFNAELIDSMEDWRDPVSRGQRQSSAAITGSTYSEAGQSNAKMDFSDIFRQLPQDERERIQMLAVEFVETLSSRERKAIELAQLSSFSNLSQMDQANALGLSQPSEIFNLYRGVGRKTEEFIQTQNLLLEDQDLLHRAVMVVLCPSPHWPSSDEE